MELHSPRMKKDTLLSNKPANPWLLLRLEQSSANMEFWPVFL